MKTLAIMADRPRPYIMSHRGNSELCPENTMAAFKQALEDGTDVIETDLHLSADGVLMCIHDATVDRTTNGTGKVKDKTCAELQQLSASYGKSEFAAERIPTLEQLLNILPADVGLGLELKSDAFLEEETCIKLMKLLQATGTQNRVVVLSFERDWLEVVKRYTDDIPTGLITMFGPLPEAGWQMIGPFWPMMFINPLYAWIGRRRGQFVCPLDPTPEPRLWYYKLLGCDAVLTNNPAKTRRALGRSGS